MSELVLWAMHELKQRGSFVVCSEKSDLRYFINKVEMIKSVNHDPELALYLPCLLLEKIQKKRLQHQLVFFCLPRKVRMVTRISNMMSSLILFYGRLIQVVVGFHRLQLDIRWFRDVGFICKVE